MWAWWAAESPGPNCFSGGRRGGTPQKPGGKKFFPFLALMLFKKKTRPLPFFYFLKFIFGFFPQKF